MFISHLGSDDLDSNVVRISDAKGKTPSLFAVIMCDGAMECALVFMLLLHSTSCMFSFCYAGAQFLACGSVASSVCVCAAMKKKIMVFEITKLKARYTKLKVQ